MKRSASLPTILNKNVQFIDNPICWVFYTLLFLAIRVILSGIGVPPQAAWTVVNIIHGSLSFVFFHWIKGTPFIDDHGTYAQFTFWEQIDDQFQFTRAKKFLMIFPIILFFLALDAGKWELAYVWMNFPILFISILPKMAFMHGIRLFGING